MTRIAPHPILILTLFCSVLAPSLAVADESSSTAEKFPRVLLIITKDSPKCEQELARLKKPGGDFENMRSQGWKIGDSPDNHVQIVDRAQVEAVVKTLDAKKFPAVVCVDHDDVVRAFREGCTTPLDAWTFGWLATGINLRPPGSVPEAAHVATTGNYPLRGNHWSIEGDWNASRAAVIAHLRGSVHGTQIKPQFVIESWSYEELLSLHDDLHEHEMGGYRPSSSSGNGNGYTTSNGRSKPAYGSPKIYGF